jgi:hypothetical protein
MTWGEFRTLNQGVLRWKKVLPDGTGRATGFCKLEDSSTPGIKLTPANVIANI